MNLVILKRFLINLLLKISRLGLQAISGMTLVTFFLGILYRSASLYHPQRRAILHLKNQKRKIKDRTKSKNPPPFFETSMLKSRTVQMLMISSSIG